MRCFWNRKVKKGEDEESEGCAWGVDTGMKGASSITVSVTICRLVIKLTTLKAFFKLFLPSWGSTPLPPITQHCQNQFNLKINYTFFGGAGRPLIQMSPLLIYLRHYQQYIEEHLVTPYVLNDYKRFFTKLNIFRPIKPSSGAFRRLFCEL
jgi:hypothetical protein